MKLQISCKFSHSGHYKHALTPICLRLFFLLRGLLFLCLFWGLQDTDCTSRCIRFYSDEKLPQKTRSKNCANCSGLLPHMSHTTHAKHQNQNLYFRERERELLSEKSETWIKPPATHSQKRKEPFWSLPTIFDPICLWLFFLLGWLLFLGLFWGLQDTESYSKQKLPQKTRSKSCANCGGLPPHITHITNSTSAKHQTQTIISERAVQHWDKRMKPPAAHSQEG